MKMKYFPLTFLGAGLIGAILGGLFCNILLRVSEMAHSLSPNIYFEPASTSLYASVASAITSMIFWGFFVLLPNCLSISRGITVGVISSVAAVPLVTVIKFCVNPDGYVHLPFNIVAMLFGLIAGLYGVVIVGIMSYGTIFVIGGVAGWLYVLLVRRVFSLGVQPLPPIQ